MKNFIKSLLISVLAFICVSGIVFAYTVVPGDTLWKIAQKSNLSVLELLQINPQINNPELIHTGNEINTGEFIVGGGGGVPITDYETTLSQPLTSSATTINVADITTTDGHTITAADFAPAIYFILDPNNDAKKEIVKCTGVSGIAFTGCTRGLAFYGTTETAVSANQKSHGAGVLIVNSNVHYYYVSLNTDQTWAGVQTFDIYPVASSTIGYATTSWQLISFGQANALVNQGAATSTESVAGISELGTRLEMASSTFNGVESPLVLQTRYSSDNTRGFVDGVNQVATTSDQVATTTNNFFAQTFLTSATTTRINAIDISLKKTGTPTGLFRAGIYLTDSDGAPTTNLRSTVFDVSTLGTAYEIKRLSIAAAKVSPNTKYAIVLNPLSATISAANYINWAFNDSESGDLYSDGTYYSSTTDAIWTASTTADFYFQIFGNEPVTNNTAVVSDSSGKIDQSYFDLTQNYSWSGLWNFDGGFLATASSTVIGDFKVDGNATSTGQLAVGTFKVGTDEAVTTVGNFIHASSSDATFPGTSETTICTATIPGGTLGTGNAIKVTLLTSNSIYGNGTVGISMKYGSTTIVSDSFQTNVGSLQGILTGFIFADGATNAQRGGFTYVNTWNAVTVNTANGGSCGGNGVATEDSTGDLALTITATLSSGSDILKNPSCLIEKIY